MRNHVKEHRKELQHGPREHKHMPDRMVIGELLPQIEDDAERISDAARRQKPKTARRKRFNQRFGDKHNAPAEREVEHAVEPIRRS